MSLLHGLMPLCAEPLEVQGGGVGLRFYRVLPEVSHRYGGIHSEVSGEAKAVAYLDELRNGR